MLNMGIPKQHVVMKMQGEGADASVLDLDPEGPAPAGEGEGGGGGALVEYGEEESEVSEEMSSV